MTVDAVGRIQGHGMDGFFYGHVEGVDRQLQDKHL